MGYFLSLCSPNPSWVFAAKKLIFLVSSDHRSQSHLKFQSCLISEYAGDCFGWVRRIFLETLPNNMWWCRGCLIFFKGFLTPKLNLFLQFSSCGPWRVFSHSNSPSHRALGRYRHTSSSRQIHNIFCWLKSLNYCPDGGNGNFHCSSSFLKATSLICEAQLSFAAHQKYVLWFFSLWWMINLEFGLCFPSYLYFCETGSHGWIISCS